MFYKFLDKQYVAGTAAGRLKFGRLRYYQLLEIVTGDQWIGDRKEGLAKTTVNATLRADDPNDAALIERAESAGLFRLEPGRKTQVTMKDVTLYNVVDCFVFCVSNGDLAILTTEMTAPERKKYAYDGCIHLVDPAEIAKRIWERGTVDGQPVSTNFEGVRFGPVTYEWKESEFTSAPVGKGDPFLKDAIYSPQREWRFVLFPRAAIPKDSVFVECESISDLLVPISLSLSTPTQAPSEFDGVSDGVILGEFTELWRCWDEAKEVAERDNFEHLRPNALRNGQLVDPRELEELLKPYYEALSKRDKDLNAWFDRALRGRMLKLYFEIRSRPCRGGGIERIDSAILMGAPAFILRNRFVSEPFSIPWESLNRGRRGYVAS